MITNTMTSQPEQSSANTTRDWFVTDLERVMAARDYDVYDAANGSTSEAGPTSGIVFNRTSFRKPQSFRRRSKSVFVVGVAEAESRPDDILTTGYHLLVRSLSNLFILLVPHSEESRTVEAHFITPERGHYVISNQDGDAAFLDAVTERLAPLATSQLIIDNDITPDLPQELWEGDSHTEAIYRVGLRLKAWDLIPAPYPMEEVLPPEDLRHVRRLFGLGGLSYGNVSARRDATTFWMSASGVDKSNLRTVGEDILLVTGYDGERRAITLSVPPGRKARRASVDAIEHLIIYQEHPEVGAILHIHAWMDNIPSTKVNYPCGTLELAYEVADLVRNAEHPERAVIGLRNHGLTITGPSLDEILERIDGRIIREIPML
jgi:ribulose-5-phosphate 4-epimerase/fuculose-1-phosphate aldolase